MTCIYNTSDPKIESPFDYQQFSPKKTTASEEMKKASFFSPLGFVPLAFLLHAIRGGRGADGRIAVQLPPARLLNLYALGKSETSNLGNYIASGIYSATNAQIASLTKLEEEAIQAVIHDHSLASDDDDAVLSWARDDATAQLWALVIRAIHAMHNGTATDDQVNVNYWFAEVKRRHSIVVAEAAGYEYTRWAGFGSNNFRDLLATNPSFDQLKAFFDRSPYSYTNGAKRATASNSVNGGFCVYRAPPPLQNEFVHNVFDGEAALLCTLRCSDPITNCPPYRPTYEQFQAFGAARIQAGLYTSQGGAEAARAITVTSVMASVATAGAIAIGIGIQSLVLAVAPAVALAFQQAVFPFAYAIGAAIGATGIGIIVTAIIYVVTSAILYGLEIFEAPELPGKLAGLIAGARTSTVSTTLPYQSLQDSSLFVLFIGATLPAPVFAYCLNSIESNGIDIVSPNLPKAQCLNALPAPEPTPWDPLWNVTVDGGSSFTTPAIELYDYDTGLISSKRLNGNWIVSTSTVNGTKFSSRSLRFRYTSWDSRGYIAQVYAHQTPAQILSLYETGLSNNFNISDCQQSKTCILSTSIKVVDVAGQRITLSLITGTQPPSFPTCTPGDINTCPTASSITAVEGPSTVQVGSTVNYTAIIASENGFSFSGTVDFSLGIDQKCSVAVVSATREVVISSSSDGYRTERETTASAECSITFSTTGSAAIVATYNGDSTVKPSRSGLRINIVTEGVTTSSLQALDSAIVGEALTLRASVKVGGNSVAPQGTVAFLDDVAGAMCRAVPLTSTGPFTATCQAAFSKEGVYSVRAIYSGGGGTYASVSPSSRIVIRRAFTITTFTPSATRIFSDQEIKVRATVTVDTPGLPNATGEISLSAINKGVQFFCNNVTKISSIPFVVDCMIVIPYPGVHQMTAEYGGDYVHQKSLSPAIPFVVITSTTTALSASYSQSVVGQSVVLIGSMSESEATNMAAQGSIYFTDGKGNDCRSVSAVSLVPLNVTCTMTFSSPGMYNMRAVFTGDSLRTSSTSLAMPINVSKGATLTTVRRSQPSATVGQPITIAVSVVVKPPGYIGGLPQGNVTFYVQEDRKKVLCSGVALSLVGPGSYAASCEATFRTAGLVYWTAIYVGDAVTYASSSNAAHVAVSARPTKSPTFKPTLAARCTQNCITTTKAPVKQAQGGTVATPPPSPAPTSQSPTVSPTLRPTTKPTNAGRKPCPTSNTTVTVVYTTRTTGNTCNTPECKGKDGRSSVGTPFFVKGCGCGCYLNSTTNIQALGP